MLENSLVFWLRYSHFSTYVLVIFILWEAIHVFSLFIFNMQLQIV